MVGPPHEAGPKSPASSFFRASLLALASLLLTPSCTHAQSREAFADATAQLMRAAEGEFGDEGRTCWPPSMRWRAPSDWDAALARAAAGGRGGRRAANRRARTRLATAIGSRDVRGALGSSSGGALAPRAPRSTAERLALDRLGRTTRRGRYRDVARAPAPGRGLSRRLAPATPDAIAAPRRTLRPLSSPGRSPPRFPADALLADTGERPPAARALRAGFCAPGQGRCDEASTAAPAAPPILSAAPLMSPRPAPTAGDAAGAIERLWPWRAVTPAEALAMLALAWRRPAMPRAWRNCRPPSRSILGWRAWLRWRRASADAGVAPGARQVGQAAIGAGDWARAVEVLEPWPQPSGGRRALCAARGANVARSDLAGAARAFRAGSTHAAVERRAPGGQRVRAAGHAAEAVVGASRRSRK